MNILILHQNAPGQFRHLAPFLAADESNDVVVLGEKTQAGLHTVRWKRYPPIQTSPQQDHPYLHRLGESVRRGQAVARACLGLIEEGFEPDVVVAHPGWGEAMFLREVLPQAKLLMYCELFYRSEGQDSGYLPETTLNLDGQCRLQIWNTEMLIALTAMDRGISPTAWQKAQYPDVFWPRIGVVHDGVDIAELTPSNLVTFRLSNGELLTADDEVVTYVARNLEPVRGFPAFMRSLPELLRRRPAARVVICGEDGVSYGRPAPGGRSWRTHLLEELPIDARRVHFVGRLPRADFLALLQVSSLHLYLSVPFVLSWSCVEALAMGCLVLASDVAPVREVIQDAVNGFLVDGRESGAIARRAADLLASRSKLGMVRARARSLAAQRFDRRLCLAAQWRLIQEIA